MPYKLQFCLSSTLSFWLIVMGLFDKENAAGWITMGLTYWVPFFINR